LRHSYGIGYVDKLTTKELAEVTGLNIRRVAYIKKKAL